MSNRYTFPNTPQGESDARESLIAAVGADPFELLDQLADAGRRKARAEGIAYQMQEGRKIVLATIATELAQVHAKENMSEAKLERMARADARYDAHIKGTAAAMEERELAASEYYRLKGEIEWCAHTAQHRELHEIGRAAFEAKYNVCLAAEAKRVSKMLD